MNYLPLTISVNMLDVDAPDDIRDTLRLDIVHIYNAIGRIHQDQLFVEYGFGSGWKVYRGGEMEESEGRGDTLVAALDDFDSKRGIHNRKGALPHDQG